MLISRGSRLCLLLSCLVLFATAAFAYPPSGNGGGKGGGGNGGGEDPPPPEPELPPIEYVPTYISMPIATDQLLVNDLNDSAMAVGWYIHTSGTRHGWLYDSSRNASTAIDLNDLPVEGKRCSNWGRLRRR